MFVPAFNDQVRAIEVVREVAALSQRYRTLLIDDGSRIPAQHSDLPANSLFFRMPMNVGLGASTHVAFDHALAGGYRAVVRLDGDGQHPVAEIAALLEPIERGVADVVVGSRSNHNVGSGGGAFRRIAKAYYRFVASLMTRGAAPADVNTGFFAANMAAVERLNRFTFERFPEPEIYVLACRENLRVHQVAVEQAERSSGRSTLGTLQGLRMLYRFSVFAISELLRRREP